MEEQDSELLKIQHEDGAIVEGVIVCIQQTEKPYMWTLSFTSPVTAYLEFTEYDVFECLTSLRRELVKQHYRPLCNGARRDVYPSGMCRDMGSGFCAYEFTLGKQAKMEDLVSIFDYAEPESIATVDEQLDFYQQWGDSLVKPKLFKIQHNDGSIITGEIYQYYLGVSTETKIIFRSSVTPEIKIIKQNWLECLTDLQTELARLGYRALCNGTRIDTYDFEKLRAMLLGNKVYALVIGQIPTNQDELFTFDYADSKLVGSIKDREKHYASWIDSIRLLPISKYGDYGISYFKEIYFRLIKIADLPLMHLFEVDPSSSLWLENEVSQKVEDDYYRKEITAISVLSPAEVDRIGILKSEALIGFIDGYLRSLDDFYPNRIFIEFLQIFMSIKAVEDPEIRAEAIQLQSGKLNIIDRRVSHDLKIATKSDIIGTFEIDRGQIIDRSYQPNSDYLIFGEYGLMQLSSFLHSALIDTLQSVRSTD